MILFDTDVLIDFLRGHVEAGTEVACVPLRERVVSVVTYLELVRGARDRRQQSLAEQFLSTSFADVVQLNEAASRDACQLIRGFALSHGLRIADALVAATARTGEFRLVTGNLRHFHFIPGLDVDLPAYRKASTQP